MKEFFKPEDFEYNSHNFGEMGRFIKLEYAANVANNALENIIDSWPVVYGIYKDSKVRSPFGLVLGANDKHKARLAFIEEIKKEPCLHLPYRKAEAGHPNDNWVCSRCGVPLEATWSEKK